jgi:hypothetical protein
MARIVFLAAPGVRCRMLGTATGIGCLMLDTARADAKPDTEPLYAASPRNR